MWKPRSSLGFGFVPCGTSREKEAGYLTCVQAALWVPVQGCLAQRPRGGCCLGTSTSSSPQPQHSHLVIQQLLSHLDANSRSAATVRAGIVEVLSEAAVIAATGSVGKVALKGVGAGNPSRTKNCPWQEAASSSRKGRFREVSELVVLRRSDREGGG